MSQFPQFPAMYTVGSKDQQPASSWSETPSNKQSVTVILGSHSTPKVVKEADVPMGTVATGQVISGYNQKQRAALRKGKRDV